MIDSFTVEKQLERSSGVVTATLTDESGTAVPLATVTALTLTLYDQGTRAIINSRRNQNVLNANGVTYGASNGLVTWLVRPADMACVSGAPEEVHVALFTCKWEGGLKERAWRVMLPIENIPYV